MQPEVGSSSGKKHAPPMHAGNEWDKLSCSKKLTCSKQVNSNDELVEFEK